MFRPASEFGSLSLPLRTLLIGACVRRVYPSGSFIYIQEDEADHLYFIVSGFVRLSYLMEDGSAILYAVLPPGESFGELGVFDQGTYCDMATAVGEVTVASLTTRAFRSLSLEHRELGEALAKLVARRYRSYIELTRDLSLRMLSARLAQALLRLIDSLGSVRHFRGQRVPYIGPMVTQTDLGLMARGARGNVNRALKSWERQGWVALQERAIYILDRKKLETLSLQEENS